MPARKGRYMRTAAALLSAALMAAVVLGCSSRGDSAASFSQERQDQLDQVVTGYMRERHLPGAVVGAWVPGEGTYVSARGYSNLETGEAMSEDDKFEIGSVTKSFVGTVALQLVDEGKLELDDRLSEYIDTVPNGDNITIRQLLDMTSGLFNYLDDVNLEAEAAADPLKKWPPEELVRVAVSHQPYFAPGEGWFYSNTNTILVGMIIERVTGNDLEDEVRRGSSSRWASRAPPSPGSRGWTRPSPRPTSTTRKRGNSKRRRIWTRPSSGPPGRWSPTSRTSRYGPRRWGRAS